MFKHILVPIDGSAPSNAVIAKSVSYAKETGARLTALHVIPDFHVLTYQPEMLIDTPELYRKDTETRARELLAKIEAAAREQGVPCEAMFKWGDQPYETIIDTAKNLGCDLICMASHGRRGMAGLLLGSETQKVLTHSSVPVLVFR